MSRMLSRFSKLPGLASLLSNNHQYPKAAINHAVTQIKALGRSALNNEESSRDIDQILTFMRRYSESLHVQRVACHALSNLAMQVLPARWIVQKGGFGLIKNALSRFQSDFKLCWLASSAIWNLARPPSNRASIGRAGVDLMLSVLTQHRSREKVVNTAVGALSNLSLCEDLKDVIAESENISLVNDVLSYYLETKSISVLTSGAGLLANLAVSDNHANSLVNARFLPLLLDVLGWDVSEEDQTMLRNVCAALNNLVTADEFTTEMLLSAGVESIYAFLNENENDLFANLLENCLLNIDADPSTPTTSLHLAAMHGHLDIIKDIIKADNAESINISDGSKMTCLDYAIAQNHLDIVEFLCRCGAVAHAADCTSDLSDDVMESMKKGTEVLNDVKEINYLTVSTTRRDTPVELCNLIVDFTSTVDQLSGMELF